MRFKKKTIFSGFLDLLLITIGFLLALSYYVLYLLIPIFVIYFGWNEVLSPIFEIKRIEFLQAILIWLLLWIISRILFRRK